MKSPTNLTFEVICKLGVQEVPGAVRKLILIGLLTTGIGLLFATLILITEEVMTFAGWDIASYIPRRHRCSDI